MIEKLLKLGFDELGLHRIDLRVYANNSPAIKSYVKLGFVKEGCLRKAAKFENEFWDVLIYSMLYDEWKKS
jgi:RimJ/RimL family protein N-acetyltransferase